MEKESAENGNQTAAVPDTDRNQHYDGEQNCAFYLVLCVVAYS